MAIVASDPNLEQDNKDKEQQASTPAAIPSSNISTSAPVTGGQAKPTSSGRFTNIQQYINANKNYNQEGGGFAGKVGSNLTNQEQGLSNQVKDVSNQFQTQAETNRNQYDPDLMLKARNTPNQLTQDEQTRVKNMMGNNSAQYLNNTQGLQDTDVANKINTYQQNVGLAQNEKNLGGLLQNLYGGSGQYNTGKQLLDTAMLYGNPGQIQALQKTASGLSTDIGNQLSSAQQNAQDTLAKYGQEATDTGQHVSKDLQDAYGGIQGTLMQQLAKAQEQARKTQQDVGGQEATLQDYAQGKASQQQINDLANQLGLTSDQLNFAVNGPNLGAQVAALGSRPTVATNTVMYNSAGQPINDPMADFKAQQAYDQKLANLMSTIPADQARQRQSVLSGDLNKYFSAPNAPTDVSQIATPEQASQMAALYNLAGGTNTFSNANPLENYNPSQQFNLGNTFDKQSFINDLAAKYPGLIASLNGMLTSPKASQ